MHCSGSDHTTFRLLQSAADIIDYVPPSLPPLRARTFLKVLEDNDAVIHMCIKSRAPKLRHLARTLRIDLDWLFERFYHDPSISVTYINTKEQAADIFTKANFTAAQWGCLLDLIQTRKSVVDELPKKAYHTNRARLPTPKLPLHLNQRTTLLSKKARAKVLVRFVFRRSTVS